MFNAKSFATLVAHIVKSFGVVTPHNIETLNSRLKDLFVQFGQKGETIVNLFVSEEVEAKVESYESRTTFQGTFSNSWKGVTEVESGWVDTRFKYCSSKEGGWTIHQGSFSKHDLFGERSSSSHSNTVIPAEAGQGFTTCFKVSLDDVLSISFDTYWEIKIPVNSIERTYCTEGDLQEFENYESALAWAMNYNWLNTPVRTEKFYLVECAPEELEEVLFYASFGKWQNYPFLHSPQEAGGRIAISELEETYFPHHTTGFRDSVWFITRKGPELTGWGGNPTSDRSEGLKRVFPPFKHFPSLPEVQVVERWKAISTSFNFDAGLYVWSLREGQWSEEPREDWESAIIIKEEYSKDRVILFSKQDWKTSHVVASITEGKGLLPWHLEIPGVEGVLLSIFDKKMEYSGLPTAILSRYRDKMARVYNSGITPNHDLRLFSEEDKKKALGL